MTPSPTVEINAARYAWQTGGACLCVPALVCLPGESVFLRGPSGSGKSTLLGLIAGIHTPQEGEARILGVSFHQLKAAARDRVRADGMGVIFQQFNLVPYLSLVENVLLPCRFSPARRDRVGKDEAARREMAVDLLARLGLGPEAVEGRAVSMLSVGQQQRVAAARALIGRPALVIADEPTSALDTEARDSFIETVKAEAAGATLLFVSHDLSLAEHFDRVLDMADISTWTRPRNSQGERAGALS